MVGYIFRNISFVKTTRKVRNFYNWKVYKRYHLFLHIKIKNRERLNHSLYRIQVERYNRIHLSIQIVQTTTPDLCIHTSSIVHGPSSIVHGPSSIVQIPFSRVSNFYYFNHQNKSSMSKNRDRKRRIRRMKQKKEGRKVLIWSIVITLIVLVLLYFSFVA